MSEELIKKGDVIRVVNAYDDTAYALQDVQRITDGIVKVIKSLPSAGRPQGKWIVYEGGWKDLDYYPPKCKCNQCGYEEDLYVLNAKPTNYCPNCGADMRGTDDGEQGKEEKGY